ncbi:MAG: sensor histidine kinase [Betaproteobacteria bacterium]|nr:sensor histidine kinase [Betaproteobacteria bacterium]
MQHAASQHPVFTRLANATWTFSQRYWRLVVVAMLLLLHIAVFRGVADPWARALLLAHLGLLLLWQPFLRAEQRISPTQGVILLLVAFGLMVRLDWWLLAFWVVIIAGLVGGKVYQHHAKWQRRVYLVMLVYLLALLAIAILPEIAPRREITAETRRAAEYILPFMFVLIALFPAEPEAAEAAQIIDFFYSVFLMLILVVVILGSFTFMGLTGSTYLVSLTYTVFLTAAAVLLVGLAWNPRAGGGLGVFFARYLFSIGLPVERWLQSLAQLLQIEAQPQRFLEQAVITLADLPSVAGVAWRAGTQRGERGSRTPNIVEFTNGELDLRIYSRYRLGPTLQWHLHLLGQILGEFYLAKMREEKLREASYLQAVHETGARTTHDIKNLLQSLNVLCSVATGSDYRDSAQLNALVRRQLPLVAQRLAQTLERLQRPQAEPESYVSATIWWDAISRQYQSEGVEFSPARIAADARLPRSLFDSVADNLIRNALAKRAAEPGTRVRVSLEGGSLRVSDTGSAVPDSIADGLLRAPIASSGGLGIGLYQAARQAEASGYRLLLETNRDGEVCFALLEQVTAAASADSR